MKNPTISFNLGSHKIDINIPTVKEDFFDLPILINLFNMMWYNKQFKTFITNNRDSFNETRF